MCTTHAQAVDEREGTSALHRAAFGGNFGALELLLAERASTSAASKRNGNSPLHLAGVHLPKPALYVQTIWAVTNSFPARTPPQRKPAVQTVWRDCWRLGPTYRSETSVARRLYLLRRIRSPYARSWCAHWACSGPIECCRFVARKR